MLPRVLGAAVSAAALVICFQFAAIASALVASEAQALAIDRKLGLSDRVALDLIDAADNEAARGQAAAAREFYERAIDVYKATGSAKAADGVRQHMAALPTAR